MTDNNKKEIEIEFQDSSVKELEQSFNAGPIYEIKPAGHHMRDLEEVTVDRVNGLTITICSNTGKHKKPYFKVKIKGSELASFAIEDCRLLAGDIKEYGKNIIVWWQQNKEKLRDFWNNYGADTDDRPKI